MQETKVQPSRAETHILRVIIGAIALAWLPGPMIYDLAANDGVAYWRAVLLGPEAAFGLWILFNYGATSVIFAYRVLASGWLGQETLPWQPTMTRVFFVSMVVAVVRLANIGATELVRRYPAGRSWWCLAISVVALSLLWIALEWTLPKRRPTDTCAEGAWPTETPI